MILHCKAICTQLTQQICRKSAEIRKRGHDSIPPLLILQDKRPKEYFMCISGKQKEPKSLHKVRNMQLLNMYSIRHKKGST